MTLSPYTGRPLPAMSTLAHARAVADNFKLETPNSKQLSNIIRPGARDRWLGKRAKDYTPERVEHILRNALSGNLVEQWELFDLMEETWPRLVKNLNKLKRAVKSHTRTFKPWVEEDESPTRDATRRAKVISSAFWGMRPRHDENQNGFDDTIYDILDAWAKGIAVLEIDWETRPAGKLGVITAPQATRYVHPRFYGYPMNADWLGLNVNEINSARSSLSLNPRSLPASAQVKTVSPLLPLSPQRGEGLRVRGETTLDVPFPENAELTSLDGTYARFPEDKFLICICKSKSGHASGGALLRSLAFSWAAANFTQSWFLNFAQIFGLPIRWANYDPNVPGLLEKVLEMLENMGSAAYSAFPTGTTLELKEPMRAGTDNPQIAILDRADRNCDLLILGQSGTTEVAGPGKTGGSYSANRVLEGVEEDIVRAACDFVETVFSEQFIPAINRLNFGDNESCPELCLEPWTIEDVKANADTFKVAQEIGVQIPQKFAHKKLNIPLPAEGEEVLAPLNQTQSFSNSEPSSVSTPLPSTGRGIKGEG